MAKHAQEAAQFLSVLCSVLESAQEMKEVLKEEGQLFSPGLEGALAHSSSCEQC